MHTNSFALLSSLLLLLAAPTSAVKGNGWNGNTSLKSAGQTGVAAMQLAVTTEKKIVILDKIEANPLKKGNVPYWGAELDIASGSIRGLSMKTNSFCASGAFQGDGTLVSLGGDPYTGQNWAQSGLQAIRTFKPCDDGKCQIYEDPKNLHMIRPRWYPSSNKLPDGSIMIMGGVSETTYMTPENTIEFYPKKGNNAIFSQFLKDALPWNLFPQAILLPNGQVFVAADNSAMTYDWKNNKETRLPNFPSNMRVSYPYGAASALLPLSSGNSYTPEVVFCGGTSTGNGQSVNKYTNALALCARMQLTPSGISGGWQTEAAPDGRIMGNFVLTPEGNLVLVNGAGSGTAGFYNTRQSDGSFSSAANPRKTAYLYDPDAKSGNLPDGRIIIAGSNPTPNVDTSKQNPFPTTYQIEYMSPPYMNQARPSYTGQPGKVGYGAGFQLNLSLPAGASTSNIVVAIHDLGYSTHGIQYNNRVVFLDCSLSGNTLSVTGPPNANIYPPGPAFMFVIVNGTPSTAHKVLVG